MIVNKIYNMDTKLDFGKHKGRTIKNVFEINPSYIRWAINNVSNFFINDDIYEEIINDFPSFSKFIETDLFKIKVGYKEDHEKYNEWNEIEKEKLDFKRYKNYKKIFDNNKYDDKDRYDYEPDEIDSPLYAFDGHEDLYYAWLND